MNVFKTSVKRPVTVIMFIIAIVLIGSVSLGKLPMDLFPDVEVPYLYVGAFYDGVGPLEMDQLVTKPIEDALSGMGSLKKLHSSTSEGSTHIFLELNIGTDVDFAAMEVREKLEEARSKLPDRITRPTIQKINANDSAAIEIGVIMDGEPEAVRQFVNKEIKPELERVSGVGAVTLLGGKSYHLELELDDKKLIGYGVTANYIQSEIARQNVDMPSGSVSQNEANLYVRTIGKIDTKEELESLRILLPSGESIPLSYLAEVELKEKSSESIARMNGKDWMSLSIKKQSGANLVAMGKAVKEAVSKIENKHPNVKMTMVFDQSKIILDLIKNVAKSAVSGGILAILVLYLFLEDFKSTLIVGLSLPVALITTFAFMFFLKVSINMMTLGGLALGVGMLVDNSIVVLENIFRHMQDGLNRVEAAIKGASEVALSVAASTLTTVAVFLPIVFMKGFIANLFRDLALTVSFSLLSSLFISLTLVPVLSSILMKRKIKKTKSSPNFMHKIKARFFSYIRGGLEAFTNMYRKKLIWGLKNKGKVMAISLLVFALSLASLTQVGYELFPESDDGYINMNIEIGQGGKLKETNQVVKKIESHLSQIQEVDKLFTVIGSDGTTDNGENQAYIIIELVPSNQRSRHVLEVSKEIREKTKDIAGVRISLDSFSVTSSAGGSKGLNMTVFGNDFETIKGISQDLVKVIKNIEGVEDIKSSVSDGAPEVQIQMDRRKLSRYGLDTSYISTVIQDRLMGKKASRVKNGGKQLDIWISPSTSYKESLPSLRGMYITMESGKSVPLDALVDIKIANGPISIEKENKRIQVSIQGSIEGRDLGSVVKEVKEKLENYEMPIGYTYSFGGQTETMEASFAELTQALAIAVLLVYMIMAAQFESLLKPFIIILSVPLAFGGGALGLFVFGKTVSIPAFIGAIVLSGVVVNDAILLIDYISLRKNMGERREQAIIEAGPIRLRPILMTTLTTVLALLPMLLIKKASTLAPMAAVVTGGLILSDVLLLVFVPVLYDILDGFVEKIKNKHSGFNVYKPSA